MITHTIYHIPGRKVGCTKNLEYRMRVYEWAEGASPEIEILEELHDKTDKEAGDIEWQWADKFGYSRGVHYTNTLAAIKSSANSNKHREAVRRNGLLMYELGIGIHSVESHTRAGRIGGLIAGRKIVELRLGIHGLSFERRSEIGVIAGRIGGRKVVELKHGIHGLPPNRKSEIARKAGLSGGKKGGMKQLGICPHCGHENNLASLGRWHFGKCKRRPMVRRT
jgi:hypothetical protein